MEVVEETAPAETTEQPAAAEEKAPAQEPVVAGSIPTGAEAVMEGVTVRFALRSLWKVYRMQYRNLVECSNVHI